MLKRFALWLCRVAGVNPRDLPNGYDLGPNLWLDSDPSTLNPKELGTRQYLMFDRRMKLKSELDRIGIPLEATLDATRLQAGTDAVERGQRWETFYREQGGLADMLAKLRQEAFEAAQEAGANDDQTRLAWMLQDRAYRQLQNRIEAVVISGKNEVATRAQRDRDNAVRLVRQAF